MIRSMTVVIATMLTVSSTGCADRVTLQNFDRIQTGMKLQQVEEILGGPGESYQGIKTWRGNDSRHTITIEFDDRGMVVSKTRDGF